ncbi:F-box domain-containing protein [Hirschfeldia incana]|nr:F-box domain-containing protein [Hirschfeldia incana]KAJ0237249.1 F-box domain-containing protein [Hirschfeldia incana]
MDRISSLPDGVIIHILSFLPLKRSAQTSVLSKRWRTLFAFSPTLDLLQYGNQMRRPRFLKFVERVLYVSGNSSMEKFTLRCIKGYRTKLWLRDVMNRGGLLDLDLRLGESNADLPCEIFTCKTLVELKLTEFCIKELPEDASLPALKKLFLKSVQFHSLPHVCAFAKLLSACPVLEELVFDDLRWDLWKWSRSLSSPSLRKLTIKHNEFGGVDMFNFGNITIDTPSVTHLDYEDLVPSSYQSINLNSLVEANLDLVVTVNHYWNSRLAQEGDNITSNPTGLFKGMRNVQIMNLLSQDSLEIFYLFRGAIPVFENLSHLSIITESTDCWSGLVYLLNHCPNLETLTIKGTLHYDRYDSVCRCVSGYSFLLSCPVKVVKITEYGGTADELIQLKHILEKLSRLELLEVSIRGTDDMKFQKAKDLLMLPRASSKCQIKVN